MATAFLKNYRQSPRKVRVVADVIRGKKIVDAQNVLSFMPKRAALPLKKLLDSAIANAKVNGEALDTLVVQEVSVQKGIVAHRWMPKWRGMAHPIRKRSSHVKIVLGMSKAAQRASAKATLEAPKAVKAPKSATTTQKVTKTTKKSTK